MSFDYGEHFDNFWEYYGEGDLNNSEKGAKRVAYKSWLTKSKEWCASEKIDYSEQEFARAIRRGYQSNVANRRASSKANRFVARLPYASTWLNQYRWEQEHDVSTGDLKRLEESKICECGSTFVVGRSESWGYFCHECHIKEWYMQNRKRAGELAQQGWGELFKLSKNIGGSKKKASHFMAELKKLSASKGGIFKKIPE